MTKLTPQILAMYLGCEVQTPYRTESEEGKPMNRLTGKMYEVCSLTEQCDVILSNGVQVTYRIDEIKPILRRLSDMTEDECLECSRILGGANHLSNESQISQARQLICTNDFYTKQTNVTGISWMWICTYLLSRGFDLFNLIDTNQAIEKQ